MAHLNTETSVVFLIAADRALYSHGPATENALSPNFVLMWGMSYSFVFVDRCWPRLGSEKALRFWWLCLRCKMDWCHCSRCISSGKACRASDRWAAASVMPTWWRWREHAPADRRRTALLHSVLKWCKHACIKTSKHGIAKVNVWEYECQNEALFWWQVEHSLELVHAMEMKKANWWQFPTSWHIDSSLSRMTRRLLTEFFGSTIQNRC